MFRDSHPQDCGHVGENYERWSEQNRILQDQWDRATANLHSSSSSFDLDLRHASGTPSFGGSGGHAGGGGGLLGFLAFLIRIPLLIASIVAWPVLYCIPVAITFLASALANGMLEGAFNPSSPSGETGVTIGTGVIALVLLVVLSRLDHKAARSKFWWIPRT